KFRLYVTTTPSTSGVPIRTIVQHAISRGLFVRWRTRYVISPATRAPTMKAGIRTTQYSANHIETSTTTIEMAGSAMPNSSKVLFCAGTTITSAANSANHRSVPAIQRMPVPVAVLDWLGVGMWQPHGEWIDRGHSPPRGGLTQAPFR